MDFTYITNYVLLNWLEVSAVLLSLLYLYLEINEKASLWIIGILSSSFYTVVFFNAHFYADSGLSIYYVIISIFGWYNWQKGKNTTSHNLPITNISNTQTIKFSVVTLLIYILLLLTILHLPSYLDISKSAFPFTDAFAVALSITATYMLSKKIIEHWYIWILVNTISTIMFYLKDLYPTSLLYVIYTIGSIIGLVTWKKHQKSQINGHA